MKYLIITSLVAGTTAALACIAKLLSLLFGFNAFSAFAFFLSMIAMVGLMLYVIVKKYVLPEDEEAEDPDDGAREQLAA